MPEKLSLGVLFGSRSTEHEVSVISGLQLMSRADPFKYDVVPVYISTLGEWFTGGPLWKLETFRKFDPRTPGIIRVFPDLTARSRALIAFERQGMFRGERRYAAARLDCAIPVLHGRHGEDGTVPGMLELMDVPYASSGVVGSAVGMDKVLMKAAFRGFGLPALADTSLERGEFEADETAACQIVEAALPYPVFVKPANLGSSIGVSRAGNREELLSALRVAFALDRRCLVEKGLDNPVEVNCAVLGFGHRAEPSVVEQPVRAGDLLDFKTKYLGGGQESGMASLSRIIPAPIGEVMTKKVQSIAVDVFRALDCRGVARVDFMIERGTNDLYITEINTIPGSMAYYLWDKTGGGTSYRALIDKLVDIALEEYREKERAITHFNSDIIASAIRNGITGAKGAKG